MSAPPVMNKFVFERGSVAPATAALKMSRLDDPRMTKAKYEPERELLTHVNQFFEKEQSAKYIIVSRYAVGIITMTACRKDQELMAEVRRAERIDALFDVNNKNKVLIKSIERLGQVTKSDFDLYGKNIEIYVGDADALLEVGGAGRRYVVAWREGAEEFKIVKKDSLAELRSLYAQLLYGCATAKAYIEFADEASRDYVLEAHQFCDEGGNFYDH